MQRLGHVETEFKRDVINFVCDKDILNYYILSSNRRLKLVLLAGVCTDYGKLDLYSG